MQASALQVGPIVSSHVPPPNADEALTRLRAQICDAVLIVLSLLGVPTLLASLSRVPEFGITPVMVAQSLSIGILVTVTLLRKKLTFAIRVTTLLGVFYVLGVGGLWSFGHLGGGKLMLLVFIVATALFVGAQHAYFAIVVSLITIVATASAYMAGWISVGVDVAAYHQAFQTWLTAGLTTLLLGGFVVAALSRMSVFQRDLLLSLQNEAAYSTALIQQASACLLVLDDQLRLQDWNDEALLCLAGTKTVKAGMPLTDLLADDPGSTRLLELLYNVLAGSADTKLEVQLASDGLHRDLVWNVACLRDAQGAVIGVICLGQDVTELRAVQREMVHTARLASMGSMTTSIAHELNQPLGIIKLQLANLLARIERRPAAVSADDQAIVTKLNRMDEQLRRAAVITDQMRLFGGNPSGEQALFDLNEVIKGVLRLKSAQYRLQEITLDYEERGNLPPVMGNRAGFEQVLLHVLHNAELAVMETDCHRHIEIRLAAHIDEIHLTVKDSGPGIDVSIQAQVFEPFFTTRPAGSGTGLGLSVSRKLMSDMHGTIDIANDTDGGFKVTLCLPLAQAS